MAGSWGTLGGAAALLLTCASAGPASADPIGWPQPGGPGSPVVLTYSYSNLFSPAFNTSLSEAELRAATELAFGLWARYAPIHFFEVADRGPAPAEAEYRAAGTPDIRIGFAPTLPNGDVAHAHLPFARNGTTTGLAGDIHFSNDVSLFAASTWGRASDGSALDFFSALLHETGHALGLFHIFYAPAVMGDVLMVFDDWRDADLLPADIQAIRGLYGNGRGSVRRAGGAWPLPLPPPSPVPEPATVVTLAAALGAAAWQRRKMKNEK